MRHSSQATVRKLKKLNEIQASLHASIQRQTTRHLYLPCSSAIIINLGLVFSSTEKKSLKVSYLLQIKFELEVR